MPTNFMRGPSTPAGSQVPIRLTVEPSQLSFYAAVEQRDVERLQRYQQNWNFYLGKQWSFSREDGEPLVTINLIKTIVEKGVTWLIGEGMTFDIPEKLVAAVLPHLKETWHDHNACEIRLYESALMGSVTGDVWILVTPEEPTPAARRAFPNTKTFIRIHVLGSEQVFPLWDPLDTSRVIGYKIVTVYPEEPTLLPDGQRQAGPPATKRFIQWIYPDRIIEKRDNAEAVERPNLLGELPIVHIKNMGFGKEPFGIADVDAGLVDLQRELNEKATDVSDIINYHAAPITVIIGAKVKNLERGANKVWSGLPQGTEVFNLQMTGDVGSSMQYIDFIKQSMLETTDLPETALGKTIPISNTSGVALKTAYRSIIERLKRKKPYYEEGLTQINYLILRWKQVMEGLQLPEGFCKSCGGKIVDVAIKDRRGNVRRNRFGQPITRRKCYHADPFTNEFTPPEEMRIQFVRQFSFGNEVQEAEQWRVAAYALHSRKSFWDPFYFTQDNEPVPTEASLRQQWQEDRKAPPRSTPEAPEPSLEDLFMQQFQSVKLPEGAIQLPAEPEEVTIFVERFDETTGMTMMHLVPGPNGSPMLAPVVEEETLMLVPTECSTPEYFNPLRVRAKLNDSLPQDEHIDMQLAVQAVGAGIWSRTRAMKYVKVEDPEKELALVEAQRFDPNTMSGNAGGVSGDDIPATVLQGMEEQRAAANGGDANKPGGQ